MEGERKRIRLPKLSLEDDATPDHSMIKPRDGSTADKTLKELE